MSKDFNFDNEEPKCYCSTSNNPPCSFCEDSFICEECDKQLHNKYSVELRNKETGELKIICKNCLEENYE